MKKIIFLFLPFMILGCSEYQLIKEKTQSSIKMDPEPITVSISEINWAGTEFSYQDEWLELHNNTLNDISLTDWRITGDLNFELSGMIPANGFYLMERTDDNTIPELNADLIYKGNLSNTGGTLHLIYQDETIDTVQFEIWPAGSDKPRCSMERINIAQLSNENNWQNGPGDTEGAGK